MSIKPWLAWPAGRDGRRSADRTARRARALAWAVLGLCSGASLAFAAEPATEDGAKPPPGAAKLSSPASPSSSRTPSRPPAPAPSPPSLPLHEQIDRLIEAKLAQDLPGQDPAAPATDAEFLRRAWLDLAGMIPPPAEARAFLDDTSAYKRQALIDRLLEGPTYARRMQQVFDTMLMERRPDTYIPSGPWREFIHRAFAENRPYDALVRQILSADGSDPATRPVARFLIERDADPNVLTRDVGRLFLGMDLTCCQCHDHPLIDGYKQQHYYGLYAFFNRTVLVGGKAADGTIPPGSVAVMGEKAEGDVSFTSVFKKKVTHKTGPRVLDGRPVAEASVPKGQEYLIPPDKDGKVRPVPAASRRALLAGALTSPDNPAFARNITNRLWAMMMGRGLVDPVDLHHPENPPSHPELLDLLATQFVAMKYDLKAFLRELTRTRAYQRSSEPPPDSSPELAEPKHFAVAAVRPTTPEQYAWSLMQAVGYRPAVEAEVRWKLEGADPRMKQILAADAKRQALREPMVEEQVYARLAPHIGEFISYFGGVAGQAQEGAERTSTVDQALMLSNGGTLRNWLAPASGWLVGRLNEQKDPSAAAEELYLSVLSRRPTTEERAEFAAYLTKRTTNLPKGQDPNQERIAALRELAWGLLTSTEFRFQH
ncbi:MAG: DUF1549 domain-containing protein [Isosphaeraceae bacterium]